MKINYNSASNNSPLSFQAYPQRDFDLEAGISKKSRKPKRNPLRMIQSVGNRIRNYYKHHPILLISMFLIIGITAIIMFSVHDRDLRMMPSLWSVQADEGNYTFPNLRNLVMVAGHSVYVSSSCEKVDKEDSWFLEPYQKHKGQAASFVTHIQKGVEIAAIDELSLLLFSGGETRKDAGPRSEAQSYWIVAETKGWFGKGDTSVRSRALTEEHARDSYENLLFSVCRFRELTGSYPHNISVVGYDFKEKRFVDLHRSSVRFPAYRFFYHGTPFSPNSREAALKGEALVRTQFQQDPYGCKGTLHRKRIARNPFHISIPYPKGCPEIAGLFRYCGDTPYPGSLPWAE